MTFDDAVSIALLLLAAWCSWHLLLLDTPRSRRNSRATAPGTHEKEFAGITGREAVAIAQAARDMAEDVAFTARALAYYAPQVIAGTANSRIVEGFMERVQALQRIAEARPERLARRGMRRSYERYLRRKGETSTAKQTTLPFGEAN